MKEGGKNGAILLERERERERQTRETVSTCCMAISVRYSWSTLSIASFRSFLRPYTPATQNRHNSRYVLSTDPKLCIHIAQIFTSTFRIS